VGEPSSFDHRGWKDALIKRAAPTTGSIPSDSPFDKGCQGDFEIDFLEIQSQPQACDVSFR
jgi:hypothetical protein